MTDEHLENRIRRYIDEHGLLHSGDTGIAAVSGGADSVFLLYMLKALSTEMNLRLIVAHVHHGIRGDEADRDAAFVEQLAEELGLPCRICYRDVPALAAEQGLSVEEAGRKARYECFDAIAEEENARWIALAHHRDDQVETILFHMLRGTGLKGLIGIRPIRGNRIRPLLDVDREEIEGWLTARGISWCTDSTNQDPDYARNRIRCHILPEMLKVNAGAKEHILRLAEEAEGRYEDLEARIPQLRAKCTERRSDQKSDQKSDRREEDQDPVEQKSGNPLQGVEIPDGVFQEAASPELQGELVLHILEELSGSRKDITRRNVEDILRLSDRTTGRRIILPYRLEAIKTYTGVLLRRRADDRRGEELLTEELSADQPAAEELTIKDSIKDQNIIQRKKAAAGRGIPGRLLIQRRPYIPGEPISTEEYRKMVDADKIAGEIVLRTPEPGDRIALLPGGQGKKLARFFTDVKIPEEERAGWPVAADDREVLWVIGRRLSENCKVTDDTKEVLILTWTATPTEED